MPYYSYIYKRLDEDKINSKLLDLGFKLVEEKTEQLQTSEIPLDEIAYLEKLGCEFVDESIVLTPSVASIASVESLIQVDPKVDPQKIKEKITMEAIAAKQPLLPSLLPSIASPEKFKRLSDYTCKPILNGLSRYRSKSLAMISTKKPLKTSVTLPKIR